MQRWRVRSRLSVYMRVDDHAVIKAVDAVVQHCSVCPNLDAGHVRESVEVSKRMVDLRRDPARLLAAESAVFQVTVPVTGEIRAGLSRANQSTEPLDTVQRFITTSLTQAAGDPAGRGEPS